MFESYFKSGIRCSHVAFTPSSGLMVALNVCTMYKLFILRELLLF